jgi:hypothetical protein
MENKQLMQLKSKIVCAGEARANNFGLWLTIPKDRRATLDKNVTIAVMQIQGKYRDSHK